MYIPKITPEPFHRYTSHGRLYEVGDQIFPGVGNITKLATPKRTRDFLDGWRQKPENKLKSDAAMARGTAFHQAVERYLEGLDPCPNNEATPFWNTFKPLLDCVSSPVLVEGALWNKHHCYAGTVDLVGRWDGVLSVIDWKTSDDKRNKASKKHKMQGAAYALALWFQYDIMIRNGVIVTVHKDREPHVTKYEIDYDLICEFLGYVQEFWDSTQEAESSLDAEYRDKLMCAGAKAQKSLKWIHLSKTFVSQWKSPTP
jgi:hypothetical protein